MSGLDFTHWGALAAMAFGVSFCTIDYAIAQITPDGTLPDNTSVTQDGKTFDITGGTQVGGNLFHSFKEFSIRTGDTASFNNIAAIENIFSRVTGKSVSNIDGLIRASGIANLFLINPNGIIFGPNASLNINGSFVGTTANAIRLANGDIFSTNPTDTIPTGLLNINPSAFLFNQISTQPISINSRRVIKRNNFIWSNGYDEFLEQEGLNVPYKKSLLFVGGDVNLSNAFLQAPNGRIELGGASGSGVIWLNMDSDNLRLNFPDDLPLANVSLENLSQVMTDGIGGEPYRGRIIINAENINISRGGLFVSNGGTDASGWITLKAKEIISIIDNSNEIYPKFSRDSNFIAANYVDIQAKIFHAEYLRLFGQYTSIQADSILLKNSMLIIPGKLNLLSTDNISMINTFVDSKYGLTKNNIGDVIALKADSILLKDRVIFNASNGGVLYRTYYESTREDPDSGNISLQANSIFMEDNVSLSADAYGQGNGGNIVLQANSISVTNQVSLSSKIFGQGNPGNILINASDSVILAGNNTGLFTDAQEEATGQGGNIRVNTNNLNLRDGAVLNTQTASSSRGGNIIIDTNSLKLINGGQLLASTFGRGQAGDITVKAKEIQLLGSNSGLLVQTSSTALAGNLTLQSRSQGRTLKVNFQGGAEISASTSSSGHGGKLTVTAPESITLSGDGILAATSEGDASGRAGNVLLATEKLTIAKGMRVSATTNSTNPAASGGNLTVQTSQLNLTDGSSLEAGTTGTAPGGNLIIQPNDNGQTLAVNFTGGATVSAASFGSGKGGTLSINAPESINLTGNGSVISAETTGQGAGGDLTLTTGKLTVQDGAKITVSSIGSGFAGDLKVNANSVYLNNAAKITADTKL